MRKMLFVFLSVLLVPALLAAKPVSGVFNSTDLGGQLLPGRYSNWRPKSTQGTPRVLHIQSWDGAALGTQWDITCPLSPTDFATVDNRVGGTRLLFTRSLPGAEDSPINSLWLARTSLVGEEPEYLGVTDVVWAEWAPGGQRLPYCTAERTGGVPGWKANNDLWVMTLPDEGLGQDAKIEQLLPPTADIPYAWGRSYAWSPDGRYLAYAQANEIGVISATDGVPVPLISFPEYRTQSHWAWVPGVSWAQDGYLLSSVVHEGDLEGLMPEDSPIFGLWVVSVEEASRNSTLHFGMLM